MPPRRLVVLHVSPWSERARWALDHHRLAYEKVQHEPFLGERRLRRLVGPGKARATVPVLVADGEVLAESWDIALYADRKGEGTKLVPPDREAEIRAWNDLADATMSAGRALVVASMLVSPEALDEGLPPNVPRAIRPLLRPVMRHATKWFGRKYDLSLEGAQAQKEKLRPTLEKLRAAVSGGSPYLTGSFSYADIVMASCIQGIAPVADRYLRLGPATRKAWTIDDLAAEFADVVAWRDRLYEQHRR
jgi:glutathione S-transferase